jgi:hypothetical protein
MIKRLFPSAVAVSVLALCGGCLFPKNFSKQKKDTHVSADMEKEFQARWMEKRVGDLTAQGMSPAAAQAQAQAEYDAKYSYTRPAGAATPK